jgi:drug/metabolite transporter (DMT)-like permease
MLYVFISICFSIIVSIMLKLAKRYHIDVYQAITWNYSVAMVLTWLFLKPQLHHLSAAPFYTYGALGILLPSLFIILAGAVKFTGIVRTDIAQRLSLFVPVIASFFIFGEALTTIKLIGIIVGFVAIIFAIPLKKQTPNKKAPANAWIYLLVVFLGMGVIDILFKQVALFKDVSYGTSLFIIYSLAFIIALIGLLYQVITKKMRFSWPHILIGWALGLANFGNILFYIKAHQALSKNPSIVFSSMNIGVIILGTLIGVFIFKEKLSTLNKVGIALALLAIVIIYYPQLFTNLFAHTA